MRTSNVATSFFSSSIFLIIFSFFYSFGKGKDCKFGPAEKRDGTIDEEGPVKCLCTGGKWSCTHEEASKTMAMNMEKHIKFLQKITPNVDFGELAKPKGSKTEKELKGLKKKLTKKLKEKEKGLEEKSKEKKKVKKLKGLVKKQLKKEKAKKKDGLR